MVCVLKIHKISPSTRIEPTGWIIALDIDDAVDQAMKAGELFIAKTLKNMKNMKSSSYGKHIIPTSQYGNETAWVLISERY